jgi:tetratricopeptide (TPR) repeat protein
MPIDLLLIIGKMTAPMVAKAIGESVFDRLFPLVDRARTEAIHKTSKALEMEFPSANFVEMNFRFDSPEAKTELEKQMAGQGLPDSGVLEKRMIEELSENWPEFLPKADLVVATFLKYFEEECLAYPKLQGLTLASLVREESTTTQRVVLEGFKTLDERMVQQFDQLRTTLARPLSTSELHYKKVASVIEREFVEQRDWVLAEVRAWHGEGLHTRIEGLAKKTEGVLEDIDVEISGSIFRLAATSFLRSLNDLDAAKYWFKMALMVEPDNPKTVALQAEILCSEHKWLEAKAVLEPLAEKVTEPYAKIMYAECLAHLSGYAAGYKWLKEHGGQQEDDQIKLNIAILATRAGADDDALQLFDELKGKTSPGPYPYLYAAGIYVKKATPQNLVTIAMPIDIELRMNKLLLAAASDDLTRGIDLLSKAGRPTSEIGQALVNLSKVYLASGEPLLAHKTLRKGWKAVRGEGDAWFTAASIAAARGQNRRTLLMVQKARQLAGEEDVESLARFAVICMQVGAWDDALAAVEKTLQRASQDEHVKAALLMKAYCQLELHLHDLFDETVSQLKTSFPDDESWMLAKTVSLLRMTGPQDALGFLEKEAVNSGSLSVRLQLAGLLYQNRVYDKALPLYREIALQTRNPSVFEMAVMVALEAGFAEEALSVLKDAEDMGLASDRLNHYRAIALTLSKDYDPAFELFASLPKDSLTVNDLLCYASLWEQRAQPEKAITLLEEGSDRYPSDPRLCRKLFFLYREINRLEKALEQAVRWLEVDRGERAAYFAVMMTGFALGSEAAGTALSDYLARFGQGPELRMVGIEEVKKFIGEKRATEEIMWKQYQDGKVPESAIGYRNTYGVGGTRLLLLRSDSRIMAFNGSPTNQVTEMTNLFEAKEVILDYYALISAFLLNLLKPLAAITDGLTLPEIVLRALREDLITLPNYYQEGRHQRLKKCLSRIEESFRVDKEFPKPGELISRGEFTNDLFDILVCKEQQCVYVTPGFAANEDPPKSDEFGIDEISVLDLLDLLKEEGMISVVRHDTICSDIEKRRIRRSKHLDNAPERMMVDWFAIEILEEVELLADITKLSKEIHVGPFSYAVIRSEVQEHQTLADIIQTLGDVEAFVKTAVEDRLVRIEASTRKAEDPIISERPRSITYLEEMKEICAQRSASLWTDDLATNVIMSAEGVKTVGTRTVLDFLQKKGALTDQGLAAKVAQLIKWNMYFCWVHSSTILACVEMYDQAFSNDLRALITPSLEEIGTFEKAAANNYDLSHLRVWSEVIGRLWAKSSKAQDLTFNIFDLLYAKANKSKVLLRLWVAACIYAVANLGETALSDFLRRLAFRMTDILQDDLVVVLKRIFESKAGLERRGLLRADHLLSIKANVLKAVKTAFPALYPGLRDFAVQHNSRIEALI